MPKYDVGVREVWGYSIQVDASSEAEALEIVAQKVRNSDDDIQDAQDSTFEYCMPVSSEKWTVVKRD